MDDLDWMRVALEEAALAPAHGDIPVGAVLVSHSGEELARAHNERELSADPTAHAEVLALRAASAKQGHWRFNDATLYVTLEPCLMCAGALVNARIGRLVYGARDPKAGAIESLFELANDTRLNHRYAVTQGLLAEPCAALLQDFFRTLRAQGQK
ncbi:MAG TPA: tRNA adenosine(34) deaminase TadA [Polyangiaceae bacterium]|jgi:tRNA(adenine34) deaminase|nr:tRNA adenosine(34) deaminase TadA [Polyangiaceae bacterium]